jgi:WD40 repeat protein
VVHISLSPDDRLLAGVSLDGIVSLWTTADGKWLGNPLTPSSGRVDNGDFGDNFETDTHASVHFTPDGRLIVASSSENEKVFVWDVRTQKEALQLPTDAVAVSAVSSDGRFFVAGHYDSTTDVWSLTTGRRIGVTIGSPRKGRVRHPPRSGWLGEWGRLKGGCPVGRGVALGRAFVDEFRSCRCYHPRTLVRGCICALAPTQSPLWTLRIHGPSSARP